MKKQIAGLVLVSLFSFCIGMLFSPIGMLFDPCQLSKSEKLSPQSVSHDASETIVAYNTSNGLPIELVLEHARGHVTLRTQIGEFDTSYNQLDFLKAEVVWLTDGEVHILGQTGVSFQFGDGYRTWGPYTRGGPGQDYKCLFFAENVTVSMFTIAAKGKEEKIGYYPYPS